MSGRTGIEWTDRTWNPVVGCTKVSQGCKYCYAKTVHDMRHAAHQAGKKMAPQYAQPFERVQLVPKRLSYPLSLQEPSRIFVNSVSDLFHEDVPNEYIAAVFAIMGMADRHTFQVLTKRPARMVEWFKWVAACWPEIVPNHAEEQPDSNIAHHRAADILDGNRRYVRELRAIEDTMAPEWPLPNVWLGVSVENQEAADERIPLLLQTPAAVRFLSCEPLLGPIDFHPLEGDERRLPVSMLEEGCDGEGIDWVIAGGESGSSRQNPRPMHPDWARLLRDQCVAADVPFLFKQWGDHIAEVVPGTDVVLADLAPNQSVAWGDGKTNHTRYTRVGKKRAGRVLDGRTWDEYPTVAP